MGWAEWLFGRKKAKGPTEKLPPPVQPTASLSEALQSEANRTLFGWQLCVTMQRRTPLEWLRRHGEVAENHSAVQAPYAFWTFFQRSPNLPGITRLYERSPSTMASEIGYIPDDGGDFLLFLIRYRKIVESQLDRGAMLKALGDLGVSHSEITEKLGGDLARTFVLSELQELSGCGKVIAERLFNAGFRSKLEVQSATITQLLDVSGIGRKSAERLAGRPNE